MFRFFEGLVDPYVHYEETDTPPKRILPFMMQYCRPFYGVFIVATIMAFAIAATELSLIYFTGWIVDVMQGDPSTLLDEYGTLLIILAFLVIFVRPIIITLDVALLNNTLMPNLGTLIRWRAHRHVLRQSVGWFENDFAGRIANRVMQTPPAANAVVFQVFDAISYAFAYVVGSFFILWQADIRLTVPLVVWFVCYLILLKWVVSRVQPASEASSDARSELNGRVVDGYTNVQSVKMFADETDELSYAKQAIENTRITVKKEMRI